MISRGREKIVLIDSSRRGEGGLEAGRLYRGIICRRCNVPMLFMKFDPTAPPERFRLACPAEGCGADMEYHPQDIERFRAEHLN
jgi:hypothetical protein